MDSDDSGSSALLEHYTLYGNNTYTCDQEQTTVGVVGGIMMSLVGSIILNVGQNLQSTGLKQLQRKEQAAEAAAAAAEVELDISDEGTEQQSDGTNRSEPKKKETAGEKRTLEKNSGEKTFNLL